MSSIAVAVFKSTIGLLVNKGRNKAAEKLKDGDVTHQKFRALIVREIDDVKSKLDGLSRKDLLASISFFKEGIELLYEVFDKPRSQSGFNAVTGQAARAETVCLAEEIKNLEFNDLDESETRKLFSAKESFKDARRKATEAFNNEALESSDRILAMQYRVKATILETVDNPVDALARCRVCIDELHSMAAVKNSFDVQLKTGIRAVRGLFSKEERREIICNVYHVNRVIYDVTVAVTQGLSLAIYPAHIVDTGKENLQILSDERVSKVLRKNGMEHFCVTPWSFGQEGEEEQHLRWPTGIATNSSGEFVVGEFEDCHVKVFDRNGTFVEQISLPNEDANTKLCICDVATDMNDNIFVLTILEKPGTEISFWVYKLTKAADLVHKFRLRGKDWYRGLSVSDTGKVVTLRGRTLEEYDTDGKFVRNFGKGILKEPRHSIVSNDGRVMVVERFESCVHIFSERRGDHLNSFELQSSTGFGSVRLAFHRAGEHVIVAGAEEKKDLHVEIYTKNGEFVRSVQIQQEGNYSVEGITVTTDGRIAVVLSFWPTKGSKVLVL